MNFAPDPPEPQRRNRLGIGVPGAAIGWWATAPGVLGTFGASLESLGWPIELLVHFRPQYAVIALIGVVVFSLLRIPLAAVLHGIVLLLNVVPIAPAYYTDRYAPTDSTAHRAVLINVSRHSQEYERVRTAIDSLDADIVALLEVDRDWLDALALGDRGYPHSRLHSRNDHFGVAIYSRHPIESSAIRHVGSAAVPVAIARTQIDARGITIVAAHLMPPMSMRMWRQGREQSDDLAVLVSQLGAQGEDVVLLADLNTTPWSSRFAEFRDYSGLVDAREGNGLSPGWPAWAPPALIPIDHVLLSSRLSAGSLATGPDVGSDHYPLIVEFRRK